MLIVLVILLTLLTESKFHQFFPLKGKIIKIKRFAKTLIIFTNSRHVMMTSLIFKEGTRIFRHLGFAILNRGGSRIFFRRGCTRPLLYFNTNKPHSFFLQNTSCIRKPQVILGGRGGAPPAPSP